MKIEVHIRIYLKDKNGANNVIDFILIGKING